VVASCTVFSPPFFPQGLPAIFARAPPPQRGGAFPSRVSQAIPFGNTRKRGSKPRGPLLRYTPRLSPGQPREWPPPFSLSLSGLHFPFNSPSHGAKIPLGPPSRQPKDLGFPVLEPAPLTFPRTMPYPRPQAPGVSPAGIWSHAVAMACSGSFLVQPLMLFISSSIRAVHLPPCSVPPCPRQGQHVIAAIAQFRFELIT